MTSDQVAAASKVTHRSEIEIVEHHMRICGIIPATDIRVYMDYPEGWHATVGAYDRIYIFKCEYGYVSMSVEPMLGFSKNGGLIRSPQFAKEYKEKNNV